MEQYAQAISKYEECESLVERDYLYTIESCDKAYFCLKT